MEQGGLDGNTGYKKNKLVWERVGHQMYIYARQRTAGLQDKVLSCPCPQKLCGPCVIYRYVR